MRKPSEFNFRRAPFLGFWGFLSILINANVHAESGTCFNAIKIEPSFIALNSSKDSELGAWYQELFGLEIAKEFSFPDGSVTGVLMHKGEFIVEIFYRTDVQPASDTTPESRSIRKHGVFKFGVFTDANLLDLQQCLKKEGADAGRIFEDKKLRINLLQVTDPEQNILEIISRVAQ